MTSFRDKLKEIRTSEEERHRHRVPLSDRELGLDASAESCLVARGELVKHLEKLMQEFIAEAPMFEIGHGFFEGRYALSLSYDEPFLEEGRGARKHFTRINFLLDPCMPDGSFSITTKLTIRDRDLPKAMASGNLGNRADVDAFVKFGEEQMLRFATEYFAGRARSPVPATQPAR
jgi:hypothetical protein